MEVYLNSLKIEQLKAICNAFKTSSSSRQRNIKMTKPEIINNLVSFYQYNISKLVPEWYKYTHRPFMAWKDMLNDAWTTEEQKNRLIDRLNKFKRNELVSYANKLQLSNPDSYKKLDIINYIVNKMKTVEEIYEQQT